MPLRLFPLPRPQAHTYPPCLRPRLLPPSTTSKPRPFHASTALKTDNPLPNHYEILELQPSASAPEIKRQFFALSKLHHPDRNPADPTASTRFVRLSEAYHVLSSPAKRSAYDAQYHARLAPATARHTQHTGSFSSAGYAGSRPPSGLSRRRTQFRGPPPSFYRAGGYGAHGSKRTTGHAHSHAHEPSGQPDADASTSTAGGFSPGQQHHGAAVPHFDHRGHRRTHEGVSQHFARKAERAGAHFAEDLAGSSGSMLFNFVAVGSAVVVIMLSAVWFRRDGGEAGRRAKGRGKEKEGG
ncbi:DnaJ-domain-containing protein [Mytilinidion resinicola]|uniref:DnaJ-domain-containing protein n=1 Tax=Mytilinidion resinicola TaxID=574789 RepID=A0A6A6YKJ1_9PEZI|nr:DnaJ-domain-containing protein [Mytilinidion resinicola]KAF2809341.1 DnaJ-domain-containing protein [Mytilinidion resinicola]